MKQGSLQKFKSLILSIDRYHHEFSRTLELFKCKITLRDGSNLRILEKYNHDELIYYSYYWLTATDELIIGWDNAPHHYHIKSFPHHKHIGGKKRPVASKERHLATVLSFVANRLK